MSSHRLTPFSYAVLVLVGRHGAGPHDLRRMTEEGRIYWDAAPSQWYAEPKRLAEQGLLEASEGPGRTRARTHYTLTDRGREALAEWVRTPCGLPRMQHESVLRLLAADLVDPDGVREGLAGLAEPVEAALAAARHNLERSESDPALAHRAALLQVNHRYALRLLELQREWLEEAERVLAAQSSRS